MGKFQNLFVCGVRSLYHAEGLVMATLPKAIDVILDTSFKRVTVSYLEEVNRGIRRLELIASDLGVSLQNRKDPVMEAFKAELEEVLNSSLSAKAKDAALIAILQHMIVYELSLYRILKEYGEYLNFDEVEGYLLVCMKEKRKSLKALQKVAKGTLFTQGVNKKALKHQG